MVASQVGCADPCALRCARCRRKRGSSHMLIDSAAYGDADQRHERRGSQPAIARCPGHHQREAKRRPRCNERAADALERRLPAVRCSRPLHRARLQSSLRPDFAGRAAATPRRRMPTSSELRIQVRTTARRGPAQVAPRAGPDASLGVVAALASRSALTRRSARRPLIPGEPPRMRAMSVAAEHPAAARQRLVRGKCRPHCAQGSIGSGRPSAPRAAWRAAPNVPRSSQQQHDDRNEDQRNFMVRFHADGARCSTTSSTKREPT